MSNKQPMRYTDHELEVIKFAFKDNDALLMVIRKFFLDWILNEEEQKLFSTFKDNKQLVEIARKTFLPEIDSSAPQFQLMDLFLTVNVQGTTVENAYYEMQMRQILIDYFKERFALFDEQKRLTFVLPSLSYNKNKGSIEAYIDLGARNMIVMHIEKMIAQLQELAKLENEETEAEKKAREEKGKKDSSE